jgi:hypothetical protein
MKGGTNKMKISASTLVTILDIAIKKKAYSEGYPIKEYESKFLSSLQEAREATINHEPIEIVYD